MEVAVSLAIVLLVVLISRMMDYEGGIIGLILFAGFVLLAGISIYLHFASSWRFEWGRFAVLIFLFLLGVAFLITSFGDRDKGAAIFNAIIFLGIAAYYSYNTLSPTQRNDRQAAMAAQQQQDKVREEKYQIEEAKRSETETIIAAIAKEALQQWNQQTISESAIQPAAFVVLGSDKGDVITSQTEYYLKTLSQGVRTQDFQGAKSIIWIASAHEKVGVYRRLIFGFIPSPFVSDDAVKITYSVWVIEIDNKRITAFNKFVGPDPPERKVEYSFIGNVAGRGAYGIAPDEQVVTWLETLAKKKELSEEANEVGDK